jgi:single-strand DNA-binding protein
MLNKVHLIGNLGSNIELHHFEDGGCVGKVSLATQNSYVNKQTGEKVTETQWHNLVFRNKSAQNAEKYTSKGDKVYIEGTIKYRSYEGSDGQKKYITEIQVLNCTYLKTKTVENAVVNAPETVPTTEDDDLPF